MKPNQPAGFRLHLRHLAILVVFFSIFLGLLVPVSRDLGAKGVYYRAVVGPFTSSSEAESSRR